MLEDMRLQLRSLATVLALSGCASVTTTAGDVLSIPSAEFRDYVESTFREQNRRATDLLYAQETARGERYAALVRAEDSLLAACAGLNELAVAQRDGRSIGSLRRSRLARSAPECEASALAARDVLAGPPP